MGPYWSLFVLVGPCWSLCVFMGPYKSLCVFKSSYRFLRVFKVLISLCRSLFFVMVPYGFLWVVIGP